MLSSNILTRRRAAVGAALAAGLVATFATVSIGAGPRDVDPFEVSPQTVGVSIPATAESTPDLEAGLAVLRGAPEGMPQPVADLMASPGRFGRNAQLAQEIKTSTGPGWLVPAKGGLCLIVPDPVDGFGTTCAPASRISAGLLELTLSGDETHVTTVVPDGRKAIVTNDSGTSRELQVSNNIASARLESSETLKVR